jgi:hypothetical protein
VSKSTRKSEAMGRKTDAPLAPGSSGVAHLREALKRVVRAFRAEAMRRVIRAFKAEPRPRQPDDDEPVGNWQNRTDERLDSIENKIASQNRMLLVSAVAIFADAALKVLKL